jgi:uncharacterized protein (DUF1697 family)
VTRYVALLRAVNVGGHDKIAMADLRELAATLGFGDVETLGQSGNMVLSGDDTAEQIASRLEDAAKAKLSLSTNFIVRSAAVWRHLIDANPFPNDSKRDPSQWLAMPMLGLPATDGLASLQKTIQGAERVAIDQDTLYAVYPDGIGRSKLTLGLIEKTLGVRTTARNWNTVQKLAVLAKA